MSSSHFLRMQTLSSNGKLIAAARHNKRAIQKELGAAGHIDATRIHLNYALLGEFSPEAVAAKSKAMLAALGINKLRKNAVRAIEILFSLPAQTQIDHRAYFTDCQAWAVAQFGEENLLSVDVHLDEAAPHCHVLIMPLHGGRMRGSEMMGSRQTFQARQTSFFEQVAQRYGLSKPQSKRLCPAAKESAANAVLAHLRATNDATQKSAAWPLIRDLIAHEPGRWLECLGMVKETQGKPKKLRTVAQIFTSKGKGATREKPSYKTPIGNSLSENTNPYVSVGVASKASSPIEVKELEFEVRERESDCTPDKGFWDIDTGEWCKVEAKAQLQKLAAQSWVGAALKALADNSGENAKQHAFSKTERHREPLSLK